MFSLVNALNTRLTFLIAAIALLAAACGAAPPTTSTEAAQPASAADEAPASTTTTTADAATATTTTTTGATTTSEATTTTMSPTTTAGSSEFALFQEALEASAEVTSGRMEGLIEITGLDPAQGFSEMSIPFGGAFDNASGDFSFYMDMSGLAEAAGEELPPELADLFGEMEVRQIGDRAYMKFAFFGMLFGAETEWISMPAEDGNTASSGFTTTSPSNPSEILGSFEGAGATVEFIGQETVNGVQATHYRAVFDTEALLATATPEERARLEAQGPLPAEELPMDVWISDDGFVVRFVMEIDGSGIETAPDESFERMIMRYDLFDLNGDVAIEPPPASETTDIEDLNGGFGL